MTKRPDQTPDVSLYFRQLVFRWRGFDREQALTSTTCVTQMWFLPSVDHFVTVNVSCRSEAGKHKLRFGNNVCFNNIYVCMRLLGSALNCSHCCNLDKKTQQENENVSHPLPHNSQMYGFSPECRLRCVCKFPAWKGRNAKAILCLSKKNCST